MLSSSFTDYEINLKQFKKEKRINKGGFGIVYLVQQVETGQFYAAKVIDCNDNKDLCKKIIDREIEIMMYANNPTIIKFIGYSLHDFQNENNIIIFMELAENGSLLDVIQSIQKHDIPKDYNNTIRQLILVGVARGMKYLHDRNIIHRDIKPGNILLDRDFHPHISDFGMSKFFEFGHSASQSQYGGTLQYMAPEVIDGEPYNTKADVYSFGILMFEVVTDLRPYPELDDRAINNYNFTKKVINENFRPTFSVPVKKSIQNLIQKCWSKSPNDRPTFKEIFNKLAYGKSEDENEEEDDDNPYYLENVDSEKILSYVYEITEITDPIEKLNKQIEDLEKENKKLKANEKQLEISNEKLTNYNDMLLTKNDQLTIENKKLLTDNNELLTSYKKLIDKKDKLTITNENLSNNNNKLVTENKKLITKNDKLTIDNSQLLLNNQNLTNNNKQLLQSNQQLTENIEQLLMNNDLLTKDNEQLTTDKKQLEISNNDLISNNDSLFAENENLSTSNKQLIADNKKLTKDVKQLTTFNKLADNKKEQLMNFIESLNNQINILNSENRELSNDIQSIINEYEIQIISNNNIKFVKELNNITINEYNSLPLSLQKIIISGIISNSSQRKLNNFLIKMNNLILYLLNFKELSIMKCFEIITNENDNQNLSRIENEYSIQLSSIAIEVLFTNNEIKSNSFISLLSKFENFSIVLKYPTLNFNEIFEIISNYKSVHFTENQMKITIFISGINHLDCTLQNNKNIDYLRFDSFVKSISSNSFKECTSLKSVQFDNPSFFTSIEDFSFQGCSSLKQLNMPNTATEIKKYAFNKCSSLEQVKIPSSLTKLGIFSFSECTSLKQIIIPSSVIEIGEGSFSQCESLTKVIFNENSLLTSIGQCCFKKCKSLKNITIPSYVTEIKNETFSECTSLNKVIIPFSVVIIKNFAFNKCSSLRQIHIPSSVTEIKMNAFSSCSSLLKIEIPSSVTEIGRYAFNECSSLIEIIIPSSVTKIGESAFCRCSSLTQISIPSSITKIEMSTFNGCYSLHNVEIPFSVASIDDFAFYRCNSLHQIEIPYTTVLNGANIFSSNTVVKKKYNFTKKIKKTVCSMFKFFFYFNLSAILIYSIIEILLDIKLN